MHSAKLIEALGVLGIGDTENITRVVIDLKMGVVPRIYVEHHGGGALLDVIESLDGGPRIEWVTEPAPRANPEHYARPLTDQCPLMYDGMIHTFADHLTEHRECPVPYPARPDTGAVDIKPDPWLRA